MKQKDTHSKTGLQILNKPSMKVTVWAYSSFVVLLTVALLLFFNLYDHDRSFALGTKFQIAEGNEQSNKQPSENLQGNNSSNEVIVSPKKLRAKNQESKISKQDLQSTSDQNTSIDRANEVIDFDVIFNDNQVHLSWTSVSDSREGFTIERSTDGEHFEEIQGDVIEEINGPDASNYSAIDVAPINKITSYRVRHIHPDGHASYSQERKINRQQKNNDLTDLEIISVGPNPFNNKLSLSFNQQVAFEVDFEIINASGIAVFIDVINAHEGLNQYDFIDQAGLPKGTYFLTLLYNHKKQVRKIIKN